MPAREKLNSAYLLGAAVLAAVLGAAAGSWLVFGVALAVLVGLGVHAGDIRPRPRRR